MQCYNKETVISIKKSILRKLNAKDLCPRGTCESKYIIKLLTFNHYMFRCFLQEFNNKKLDRYNLEQIDYIVCTKLKSELKRDNNHVQFYILNSSVILSVYLLTDTPK